MQPFDETLPTSPRLRRTRRQTYHGEQTLKKAGTIMNNIIFAAIGGAVGSSLRYALTQAIKFFLSNGYHAFATTTINLIGCIAFGIFYALSKNNILSEKMTVLTMVGLTGGFTTFALFNFENLRFFQEGKLKLGLLNIIISLAIGTLCIIIGSKICSFIITTLKHK